MTPRILKNMNATVNGKGTAGMLDEIELPEIEIKTDEHRAGGMDAPTEVDMGQAKMNAKLKIADPDEDILSLVGIVPGNATRLIARGGYVRDHDNVTVAAVVELAGKFTKGSFETWKSGDKSGVSIEMAVDYYKLTIGGREIYEIDVLNMKRIIGGVDQLAALRQAIGL
jgi:P2 family phage contractile tail tube protein